MCCHPKDPKCVAKLALRIAFGGALALVGVNHYMSVGMFAGMVSSSLGPLSGLGTLWAYVLPALQIAGGVLIVAGYRMDIAAWCAGIALASIIIGSLMRPILGDASLGDPMVMGAVNNTFIWLLVYLMVIKGLCCGTCGKEGEAGGSSGSEHSCPTC